MVYLYLLAQVTSGGVRLLEGTVQIQHIPVDVGSPLVAASLADPYLAVLSESGTLMIFTLVTLRGYQPRLTPSKPINTCMVSSQSHGGGVFVFYGQCFSFSFIGSCSFSHFHINFFRTHHCRPSVHTVMCRASSLISTQRTEKKPPRYTDLMQKLKSGSIILCFLLTVIHVHVLGFAPT